ncbi:MAG TPA: hypothetical protein VM053_06715 [Gemmatimonadaceae bacterium]|nr:hypothetical protein [Gemmatimonadaceae bacterium]
MTSVLSNAKMYGQFALGLRRFLKNPPQLEAARAEVDRNLRNRESNFLRIAQHGIYDNPRSPYLKLLRNSGVEFGDLAAMTEANGLDDTLRALRAKDIYVSFEEFKGRTPIVRGSFTLDVSDKDFDNPRLRSFYEGQTSGSTGAGTRVAMDLEHMSAMMNECMVYMSMVKDLDVPIAVWFPVLPASSGLMSILMCRCLGLKTEKWFTPVTAEKMTIPFKYRMATEYARGMARLFGVPVPSPEPVSIADAGKVALWAHEQAKESGSCIVVTYVSLGVRISVAAQEMGLDMKGVRFVGAGEPPTPAKVRAICKSGATFMSSYGFTEGGVVGLSCRNPLGENDLHLFRDAWGLIQSPVQVPGSTLVVDAFCFTALLPTVPKIIFNVELDDYGILDQRDCGCPMQAAGFPDHVRDIFSFRKLTGEGMTLVGSTMLRIMEEVLPTKFGGTALDYQLVEEEDENGFTRLTFVVSPKVGTVDERHLIDTVLDEVSRDSPGADLARAVWRDAGTLRVRREDPTWSTLGKLLSLRPAKRNAGILFDEKS